MNARTIARLAGSAWLVLLVAAIIVVAQMAKKPPRPIYADELQYLTVSRNLVIHGVYSDQAVSDSRPAPTSLFTPIAPVLYALLLKADPALHETIACQFANSADPRAHCQIQYSLLTRGVMAMLAVIGLWASWPLARSLGLSPVGAWTVLAVVAASGTHALFAAHFLTESPLLALFPFFFLLLVRATDPAVQRSAGPLLALGVILGLLALTRPSNAYQAYAVILAIPLLRHFRHAAPVGRYGLGALLLVAAAYWITVLPWLLRNLIALGQFTLTTGYDTDVLTHRLAYNQMSWGEWARAWIYWLPDFGDNLAIQLFGNDAVSKLSLINPAGYHGAGNPPVPIEQRIQPDGSPATLGYLMMSHLLPDLPKHLAVTLAMAWQGLWAGKYITFIAVLLSPLAMWCMAAAGWLRGFLVMAAPALLMVGFYAFISVSIPRYNLPLLWVSALIFAALVEAAVRRLNRPDRTGPSPRKDRA
jgi:hypothetical protein